MRRVRQHVNPLLLRYRTPRTARLTLPPGDEIEVELGCAEAQFLFERAERHPERGYVGLEIREELVRSVNERAQAIGAPVVAAFSNINVDLQHMFEAGAVARAFINFPDPWFKTRHHKRRLMEDDLVVGCHHILREGGELLFQSDVWDLALDALEVLERHPDRFENLAGAWSFWKEPNPYGVRSRREQGCEEEGAPVWRIFYKRRGRP